MATPFESAQLNLQLFDLRREPVLREARSWFISDFNPETFNEFMQLASGDRNASFRMVIGYWDMAASLVINGAIDGSAFLAAHGEIFAMFSKIQPFLAELRTASGEPEFCQKCRSGGDGCAGCGGDSEKTSPCNLCGSQGEGESSRQQVINWGTLAAIILAARRWCGLR